MALVKTAFRFDSAMGGIGGVSMRSTLIKFVRHKPKQLKDKFAMTSPSVEDSNTSQAAAALTLAGWLAILSAVVALPLLTLSFTADSLGAGARKLDAWLSIADAILNVNLFLWLRGLLNSRFEFHQADTLITWNVCLLILATIAGVARDVYGQPNTLDAVAVAGIALLFCARLSRLPSASCYCACLVNVMAC